MQSKLSTILLILLLLVTNCKQRHKTGSSDILSSEATGECFPGSPPAAEKCGVWFPYDYNAPQEMYDLFKAQQWNEIYVEPRLIDAGMALGLTREEILSISAYTQVEFTAMNAELRTKNISDKYQPLIYLSGSGLRKLPKFVGTVFRGTNLRPEILEKYQTAFKNKTPLQELGFMSTTSSEEVLSQGFGAKNGRFIVESSHGAAVDMLSTFPEEKEVLFPPGTWFQIVDIKQEQLTEGTRITIKMKELSIQ
ncbi:MAG: ADP-ribosyltransferase domain-containing protein [Oligoflexales bacterium]